MHTPTTSHFSMFAHEKRTLTHEQANAPYSTMPLLLRMEYADDIETLLVRERALMHDPALSQVQQNLHETIYFALQAEKRRICGNAG